MADPGQTPNRKIAPGVAKWRQLKAAGFDDNELTAWQAEETAKLQAAEFEQHEIDAYWGKTRGKGDGIRTLAQVNTSKAETADNPWEYLQAGFGVSATGLGLNKGAPQYVLPKDAGIFSKTVMAVGQVAGDAPIAIPAFIAAAPGGAAVGGAIGAAIGGPAAPATAAGGAVIGSLAAGGAAAAAAPVAVREALLNAYQADDVDDPEEFAARLTHSIIEVGKAGTVGLITAPVGGAVGGKVAAATGKAVFGTAADITTQSVGGAAIGGALSGQMPTRDDFVVGLVTGIATEAGPALVRTAKGQVEYTPAGEYARTNAEAIYRRTGTTPRAAGQRAQSNPVMRQELIQQNVYGDPVIPRHMDEAPPEVEAYQPPAKGTTAAGPKKDTVERSSEIIGDFEGFRTNAYWDVNHWRVGYGSDTVTNPDGSYRKTVKGDVIDQAAADRDRARRIKQQFLPLAREAVGEQWYGLDTDAQAALVSVTYNYGRLPTNVVRAAKTGDPELIAQAVEKLQFHNDGVNKARRLKEAQMIRGGGGGKGGDGGGDGPPAGGEGGLPVPFGKRKPLAEMTDEALRAEEAAWSKKAAEEREAAILQQVGDPKKNGLLDLLDPDLIVDQYVSELRPARLLDNQIFEAHPGFDRDKTYGVEDAFRNTYASDDRAALFLKHGPVDGRDNTFIGDKDSPSLMKAADQAKKAGGNMDGWRAYMLALRTVEKAGQGIETGIDPALARAHVNDPKEFAKYKDAVVTFQKTGLGVIKYAVEKGRYSPEQAARMVKANLFWVSMRRAQGDHEAFRPSKFGKFKVGPGIRKMEGSDLKVVDPIMASIDNWRMIVADADRNEAAGVVVRAAEGGLIPPEWGIEHVYTIGDGELSKSTDLAKYVQPDEVQELTMALAPDIAVQAFKGSKEPGQFLYFRDGKPEVWVTKSEALARLLQGAESVGEANIIVAAAQGVASLKRAGITSLPEFALKTTLADQVGAFVLDPSHPPPFITLALGVIPALTHNKTWKQWAAAGGAGASAVAMDVNFLTKDMARKFETTGFLGKMWNTSLNPVEWGQVIQERVDAAQRIGHWRYSQKVGKMEPRRAAMQGRKTYIDFKERATLQLANTMAKVTPFLRPFLLGMKNVGEAVAQRPLDTALALGVAGIVSVGLTLLNIANDDDLPETEKYANMPDWQKDMFITTPQIAGMRFKVAVRDAVGVTHATSRRFVEFLQGDKNAFDGLLSFYAKTFLFDLTPAIAQPVLEDRSNFSFFMDRPLIPASLEKASGPAQYTENTTETAKKLARWLGNDENPLSILGPDVSPIIIDNYIRGYAGPIGIEVARVLNPVDPKTRRPKELTDNAFVAAFVHREPRASAQPISDFYEKYQEVQAAKKDMSLARKRRDDEELARARENPLAGVSADHVATALRNMRDHLDRINSDPDMTVDEKRQYSERLYSRMIVTARRGLEQIEKREERAVQRQERREAADVPTQPAPAAQAPSTPPVAPLAGQMALN